MNNTDYQFSEYRPSVWYRIKQYFKMPRLYASLLTSDDPTKPAITVWSFGKRGPNIIDRIRIEEEKGLELFCVQDTSASRILLMFFLALFKR